MTMLQLCFEDRSDFIFSQNLGEERMKGAQGDSCIFVLKNLKNRVRLNWHGLLEGDRIGRLDLVDHSSIILVDAIDVLNHITLHWP